MGRNVPLRVSANIAVICLLSPRPATSTLLLPLWSHGPSPTRKLALCSSHQGLIISSGGIACASTKPTVGVPVCNWVMIVRVTSTGRCACSVLELFSIKIRHGLELMAISTNLSRWKIDQV